MPAEHHCRFVRHDAAGRPFGCEHNAERAAEERAGRVRWLRPDYQLARAGVPAIGRAEQELGLALPKPAVAVTPRAALPRDAVGRAAAVWAALNAMSGPLSTEALASRFKGRNAERTVEEALNAYARVGLVTRDHAGWRLNRAA